MDRGHARRPRGRQAPPCERARHGVCRNPGRRPHGQDREQHRNRPWHLQRAGGRQEPVADRRRDFVGQARHADLAARKALPRAGHALPGLQHPHAAGRAHRRHRRLLRAAARRPRHHLSGRLLPAVGRVQALRPAGRGGGEPALQAHAALAQRGRRGLRLLRPEAGALRALQLQPDRQEARHADHRQRLRALCRRPHPGVQRRRRRAHACAPDAALADAVRQRRACERAAARHRLLRQDRQCRAGARRERPDGHCPCGTRAGAHARCVRRPDSPVHPRERRLLLAGRLRGRRPDGRAAQHCRRGAQHAGRVREGRHHPPRNRACTGPCRRRAARVAGRHCQHALARARRFRESPGPPARTARRAADAQGTALRRPAAHRRHGRRARDRAAAHRRTRHAVPGGGHGLQRPAPGARQAGARPAESCDLARARPDAGNARRAGGRPRFADRTAGQPARRRCGHPHFDSRPHLADLRRHQPHARRCARAAQVARRNRGAR